MGLLALRELMMNGFSQFFKSDKFKMFTTWFLAMIHRLPVILYCESRDKWDSDGNDLMYVIRGEVKRIWSCLLLRRFERSTANVKHVRLVTSLKRKRTMGERESFYPSKKERRLRTRQDMEIVLIFLALKDSVYSLTRNINSLTSLCHAFKI